MGELGCSTSGEKYISLSMSRDSDSGMLGNCLQASKKCQVGAHEVNKSVWSALPDSESLLIPSELVEFPIPKPLSSFEVKDLKEALMGDHEEQYYSEEALLGLPSPKALAQKLENLKLRQKLECVIRSRRYWPLLPLLVKAEMSPILTVLECIFTWVVFLCWVQVVLLGNVATSFLGGFALFLALNILHYWYGFTRYYSVQGDWNNDCLTGHAVDKIFEEMRDLCSLQCHGDTRRRSQTGAILMTAPFTVLNHAISSIVYGVYRVLRFYQTEFRPESQGIAQMWGIYISNVGFAFLWLYGGPFLMTLAGLNLLVSQRLYNAMLFRRGANGFLSSFLVGTFLVGECRQDELACSVTNEESTISTLDVAKDVMDSNSILHPEDEAPYTTSRGAPRNDLDDRGGGNCDGDSIFGDLGDLEATPLPPPPPPLPRNGPPVLTVERNQSDDSSDVVTEITDDFERSKTTPPPPGEIEEKKTLARLNTSDVYFELDSHEGTQAWRSAILEATQHFEGSSYSFKKHHWVMNKLDGRTFFSGSIKTGWQFVDPVEVRRRCKESYDKQTQATGEMKTIMNGLKDLRRTQEDWKRLETKQDKSVVKKEADYRKSDSPESVAHVNTTESPPVPKKDHRRFFARVIRPRKKVIVLPVEEELVIEVAVPVKKTSSSTRKSEKKRQREVYLGATDNQGYQHFLKVVKLAAEDPETAEYTDDVHSWIMPRLHAKAFFHKTEFGTYREATRMEVRDTAEDCYAKAKEERNTPQKTISVEELSSRFSGSQSVQPSDCRSTGTSVRSQPFDCQETKEVTKTHPEPAKPKPAELESVESRPEVKQERSTTGCFQIVNDVLCAGASDADDPSTKSSAAKDDTSLDERDDTSDMLSHLTTGDRSEMDPVEASIEVVEKVEPRLLRLDSLAEKPSNQGREISASDYTSSPLTQRFPQKLQNDTETITNWIGDHTKAKKSRSRFLTGIWKRAVQRTKGTGKRDHSLHEFEHNIKGQLPLSNDESAEFAPQNFDDKNDSAAVLRTLLDGSGSSDSKSLETKSAEGHPANKAYESSSIDDTSQADEQRTLYDQIMAVLEEDFWRMHTPQQPHLDRSPSSISHVPSTDGSGVGSRVPSRTLMEFLQQKLEEEYNCSVIAPPCSDYYQYTHSHSRLICGEVGDQLPDPSGRSSRTNLYSLNDNLPCGDLFTN